MVDEFQQYAKKGKQQMLYYLLDMLQVGVGGRDCTGNRRRQNPTRLNEWGWGQRLGAGFEGRR